MKIQKVACVVGARPNFMKMAPILEAFEVHRGTLQPQLVHTGQHYDQRMSSLLFDQLRLPQPDFFLGVGSGSHACQTAKVMLAFEDYCDREAPDLVLVVGDVNSTLACALTASKRLIPVAHVEAGLRSRDRTMPEEINRLLTDALSDLLFTTCREAGDNLVREGMDPAKIHFVGNVMIDSLRKFLPEARAPEWLDSIDLSQGFGLITLHRPANVDDPAVFGKLVGTLVELSGTLPFIFPCHPRTLGRLCDLGFSEPAEPGEATVPLPGSRIWLTPPLGYLEFLYLLNKARVVLTDSGGIQEESVVLGTPCLTLRENTERPITLDQGGNFLVGTDPEAIRERFREALAAGQRAPFIPEKWHGGSAIEIAGIVVDWLRNKNA